MPYSQCSLPVLQAFEPYSLKYILKYILEKSSYHKMKAVTV